MYPSMILSIFVTLQSIWEFYFGERRKDWERFRSKFVSEDLETIKEEIRAD